MTLNCTIRLNTTTMKTDIEHPYFSVNSPSRESLLKVNAELIENLRSRVNQRRFKPQPGDATRLGYYRVLISGIQVYNMVLKDTELDDLKKEIEELKELMKCRSSN